MLVVMEILSVGRVCCMLVVQVNFFMAYSDLNKHLLYRPLDVSQNRVRQYHK